MEGEKSSDYLGPAETHVQPLGIAAAIKLARVVAWLDGDDLAPTRVSAFQRLCLATYRSFPTVSNVSQTHVFHSVMYTV